MIDYEIVRKTLPSMCIATVRVFIPTNDQVPQYLDPAFVKLSNYVRKYGARITSQPFAIWLQPANVLVNETAEIAVPIDRPVPTTDLLKVYDLPETEVAVLVHLGPFKNLKRQHAALLDWIEFNRYTVIGPYRELYFNHKRRDMSGAATEIQYPVALIS